MNGFIDIHTHILPMADDGAKSVSEALTLIQMARSDGTGVLVLTPHHRGAYKQNSSESVQQAFHQLRRIAGSRFPDVQLCLGSEIFYEHGVGELLEAGHARTINRSRYVLLEFSETALRSQVLTGISEMLRYGHTPIIAHIERCGIFRRVPELVDEILEMGALIQMNAGSIMGRQGWGIRRFCHRLLKTGKVHFVASDAHDPTRRPPLLRACFRRVRKKYGEQLAASVFRENAAAVLRNEII